MSGLLFLMLVGLPIALVGGVEYLVWKIAGPRSLRIIAALLVALSLAVIVSLDRAPDAAALGKAMMDLICWILLIPNLTVLLIPWFRRYLAWEKSVGAHRASESESSSGIHK
jgi:hypothetical protein